MEFNMFPYMEHNGAWTLLDDEMEKLFLQFEEEGTISELFRSNPFTSPEDFINFFKHSNTILYFWTVDHKIGGIVWLDHFIGKRCNIHFNALKWTWGKTVREAGKCCVKKLLKFYDCIVGETPADNKLALRFIKSVGLEPIGEIPQAMYDSYADESVPVVISYISKGGEHGRE